MTSRLILTLLLAAWAGLAGAQGTIYESQGKDGPVFSDQPSPGGKAVDLPAPNVIQGPAIPQQQQTSPAAPPPYQSLAVVTPADQGTIHTNTGAFDMSVQVQPALRTDQGDVIQVKLDGNVLPQSYTSTSFGITESDWAAAANPDNVQHTLQAAIVGSNGVLIESPQISFFAHRATRQQRRELR